MLAMAWIPFYAILRILWTALTLDVGIDPEALQFAQAIGTTARSFWP